MDPPTSSGMKRPSLGPRISSSKRVRVDLPDNQLTEINNKMNRQFGLKDTPSDPEDISMALSMILAALTGSLLTTAVKTTALAPLTGPEAKRLVQGFSPQERQEWEAGFQKGVNNRDWTDLITHPKLRRKSPTRKLTTKMETSEQRAKRLHGMFHNAFQGDAHQSFIEALDIYDHIYDPEVHFGRTIPVLQSSGTGKSRMVDEIGHTIPTLSICFREGEQPELGWPPNDQPARRFFLRSRTTDFKGEELAAAFLAALMHILAKKLELQTASSREPREWMKDWTLDDPINISESSRFESFEEVELMAEKLLRDNYSAIKTARMPSRIPGSGRAPESPPEWPGRLFRLLCLSNFEKLCLVLRNHKTKYLVIAFDECSQLNDVERSDDVQWWDPVQYMTLIALQRLIKAIDQYQPSDVILWFLLLDTDSSIYDFNPVDKATSRRLAEHLRILPPWPYVGFNQMVPKNIKDQIDKPYKALTIKHLKMYGRPYWALLAQGEATKAAYEKLFPGTGFKHWNVDHVFAAFAIRACLEIGVGEASDRLAVEAVRSHMRILKGVVGSLLITTSPSEPILAIAAAEALNESEQTYEKALNTLLEKLILKGVVLDPGMTGEFGTCLMFLRARDRATTAGGKKFVRYDKETDLYMVPAVRLSTFLQTLLGDDLGISDDTDQQNLRQTLLQNTHEVWINFTYFVPLSMPVDEVTPELLCEAFLSGFAFQCVFHQPVIDGFIVAYFGKLDEPFDISKLFLVPWQTKAQADAADPTLSCPLTAPFLTTPGNAVRRKPWTVVLLMDLAATSAFGKATSPHCQLTYGKAERPSGKENGGNWRGYAQGSELEGDRYCLNIRGHRESQYPVIRGLEAQFDQLFARSLGCVQAELIPYADAMQDVMDRATST